MCGIAGIFSYKGEKVSVAEILAIRDSMTNRGPDSAGLWFNVDNRVALAHRRLSVIDLTAAADQPMVDEISGRCISFNGEIYNFKELRSGLEAKGYRFKSNSDTEVLLHLYNEYGPDMLVKLQGMYSFAIWDEKHKGIFIARDPFGIKPLYYSNDGKFFRFASQVKALLRGGAVSNSPAPAGHVGFFLWGFVPEPHTLFKDIHSLKAGTFIWIDEKGTCKEKTFCSIPNLIASTVSLPGRMPCRDEELKAHFKDTVARHLVSDVPVGVFLSSGIDSSAIAAIAVKIRGNGIHTITLGFNEFRGTQHDETPTAEATARRLGTKHTTSWISFKDFVNEFELIMAAMDQPSVDGVNTYFISKVAREAGLKVALSGLGGDETFGGYSGFRQIPKLVSALKFGRYFPNLTTLSRRFSHRIVKLFTSPKYASLLEYGHSIPEAYFLRRALYIPWEAELFLDYDFLKQGMEKLSTIRCLHETTKAIPIDHFKIMALEMDWYMKNQLLRDADWAGMAHGLEIRVPFVDKVFLENILLYISDKPFLFKVDFVRAMGGRLSPEVGRRTKTGFSVPIHKWLNETGNPKFKGRNVRGWGQLVHEQFQLSKYGDSIQPSRLLNKNKVLIHRIGLLGDTIVALPALKAIRQHFADSHISLLFDVRPGQVTPKDVLQHTSLIDSYVSYTRQHGISTFIKLFNVLRQNRYATLIYLAPSGRSRFQFLRDYFLFRLAGIKNQVGTDYRNFSDLEKKGPFYEVDFLVNVLKTHGIKAPEQHPSLPPFEIGLDKISSCENKLDAKDYNWRNKRLFAFAPGSNMPAKRWPYENFAELGRLLAAKFDVLPVVFGSPAEKELGDSLVKQWGVGINLAGATDIIESFVALQRCAAYVGNDTGTMHLAALARLKCVGIFSARDKVQKWHPYGSGHIVVRKTVPCAGCLLEVCPRAVKCVNLVQVEEVFNACVTILGIHDR